MDNQAAAINQPAKKLTPFSIFCIGFGVFMILFMALEWSLVEYLTPFGIAPLFFLSWMALIVLLFSSVIYIPSQVMKISWQAFLPLSINLVTLAIVYFVPFNSIWLDIEFQTNRSGYEQIIEMYENNELQQPSRSGYIQLPSEYKHLSKGGGEIIVDNSYGVISVFFYTYRGVLGNSSGFIYRSNDSPPPQYLLQRDCYQLERKEPKWFFCASD